MAPRNPWETNALDWVGWARTPDHDSYWHFNRDAFFDLLPEPGRATLDVGCGEGRVARDLTTWGHRVTALDRSPTLIGFAKQADPTGRYLLGDAAALPFADQTFDLVVAFNSLMDVEDMLGAVREIGRVLESGGRLCLSVTHPINDAGSFSGDEPDAPFVIQGSYFGRRPFHGTFERAGLQMTFEGWAYPLHEYGKALEEAGFLVERLGEPVPGPEVAARHPGYHKWQRVPMFLHLRAIRP